MRASILAFTALLFCSGCVTTDNDPVAKHPDHRIVVAPAAPGSSTLRAYPPECPPWTKYHPDPNDNMPQPQIGCANQRNLALMIDAPEDLVVGRPLGAGDGQRDATALQRYHENKVSGLYDPTQLSAAKE